MEAATSGAEKGKGKTITITFDPVNAPGFEGKYIGNIPDEEVITTNYVDRMFKLMQYGDIFVIFKGGSGTISEFGTAWVLAKLYYGHHKPFILFGDFWIEIIDALKKNMNLDAGEMSVFEICRNAHEVSEAIKRFEIKIVDRDHSGDGDGDKYEKAFTK
jgi:predicted Rossmann-fold nucleotide-binding protein